MKTYLLPVFLLCMTLHGISQNCQSLANSIVVSTGYDPATSAVAADYALDPMWRLMMAPPDPAGWTSNIGGPAVVVPISSSWFFAGSTSKYINAYPTNAALTDNWSLTTIPYLFERKFCICDPTSMNAPQSVTFNLGLNADNWAELEIEDAGGTITALGSQPYVYSTANFDSNPTAINVTLQLSPGEYILRLVHRNKLVDMGVNLDGTISSSGLVSDDGCNQNGTIAGFLFHDVNGNQIKDDGDIALHSHIIELYDEGQNLVSTSETDHAGYYFFVDLAPGTYSLKAISEIGWGFTPATLPNRSVEVNVNKITTADFLLWEEPTGIADRPTASFVNVFPNPANGTFNIMFQEGSSVEHQITMTDYTGAVVLRKALFGNSAQISTEDFATGIYLLHIEGEEGEQVEKVIIK